MTGTLILTKQCNLRCRYCFETHENVFMTEETALAAVDLLTGDDQPQGGISFFGGEPLLRKELIYRCVERVRTLYPAKQFTYNMTTNGLLLDEEFLTFARDNAIKIALSHDGLMSRVNRLYPDGRDCLALLDEKLGLLMHYQPKTFIMATLSADYVEQAAESVISLYEKGISQVNLALDSRPEAGWDDDSMDELGRQLRLIADYVFAAFREGKQISFNGFDEKIRSITQQKSCHVCHLGYRKLYIDWDGAIYPCIQFGGLAAFCIGDVTTGIDEETRKSIHRRSLVKPSFCGDCALKERCVNDCACLNYQQCGDMGEVSPEQCAFQRVLIETADELARRMIEQDEEQFIKRYLK